MLVAFVEVPLVVEVFGWWLFLYFWIASSRIRSFSVTVCRHLGIVECVISVYVDGVEEGGSRRLALDAINQLHTLSRPCQQSAYRAGIARTGTGYCRNNSGCPVLVGWKCVNSGGDAGAAHKSSCPVASATLTAHTTRHVCTHQPRQGGMSPH
jgi:hypothetical protein